MSKILTQILTNNQKELLNQFLDLTGNNDEVFTLTELEGFLFGLAITPDVIPVSEWLPEIFGGVTPPFDSEKQMDLLFKNLLDSYNAYVDAFYKGILKFPFAELKSQDISEEVLNEMADWAYGLLVALRLRPEIWCLDYDFKDAPKDIQEILLSFAVVHGVVYPEDAYGLFEEMEGQLVDKNLNTAMLFASLPMAVETLKKHGERLWKNKVEEMEKGIFDFNQRKVKIRRNDPCPCGSGKKYKKCCGMN